MLLADPSASVGWARARVWLGEEPQVGPKGGKLTDCTLSTAAGVIAKVRGRTALCLWLRLTTDQVHAGTRRCRSCWFTTQLAQRSHTEAPRLPPSLPLSLSPDPLYLRLSLSLSLSLSLPLSLSRCWRWPGSERERAREEAQGESERGSSRAVARPPKTQCRTSRWAG